MEPEREPVPALSSDPIRTRRLTNHLIECLQDYVNLDTATDNRDVLMAVHNFHKVAVLFEAQRLKLPPNERITLFQMAAQTFATALRDEHLRLLGEKPDAARPKMPKKEPS
jgi:hypothetical protein